MLKSFFSNKCEHINDIKKKSLEVNLPNEFKKKIRLTNLSFFFNEEITYDFYIVSPKVYSTDHFII